MTSLVLASGNAGKFKELETPMQALGYELTPQQEHGVSEVAETGRTFVENAILKARNAAQHCQSAALADDSGLCVPALHGAPGIYSSRYAGVDAADAQNNVKLLQQLADVTDRRAYFYCVLVLFQYPDDPAPMIGWGKWQGQIALQAKGDGGFGYDPLFVDAESGQHAAELSLTEKQKISHRARALKMLLASTA